MGNGPGEAVRQKRLVIILADISGYTRFMLDSQMAAVHGQVFISSLIESLLAHVDIPLTLQEIEGDAVFLYAAHPGSDDEWNRVCEEVSRKLETFFDAFFQTMAGHIESHPCDCAVCGNAHRLGLKIIVHAGEALFHRIAGRPQVSGPDVILAHRLLKNTLPDNEYLLLTEAAHALMGDHLPGTFEPHQESYEGFGTVPLLVRHLGEAQQAARVALYDLDAAQLEARLRRANGLAGDRRLWLRGALEQMRKPIRPFTTGEKLRMLVEAILAPFIVAHRFPGILRTVSGRGRPRELDAP